MSEETKVPPDLILCEGHKLAPWQLTCIHLWKSPPPNKWVRVPLEEGSKKEVDGDWICLDCYRHAVETAGGDVNCLAKDDMDVLRPVCMHCVNHMKVMAGFHRDEAGILSHPDTLTEGDPLPPGA